MNVELEHLASDNGLLEQPRQDGLAALRQLPAPIYALDTLLAILSKMERNLTFVAPNDEWELLDMVRDYNTINFNQVYLLCL